jgi:hypothetical protein
MSAAQSQRLSPEPVKEKSRMPKRLSPLAMFLGVAAFTLGILPPSSASAAEPWWNVMTGSHPTNMWEPKSSIQEVDITLADNTFFGPGAAIRVTLGSETVGCLGKGFLGNFCSFVAGVPPEETASELRATLEAALHTTEVEVTGGPVGVEPFVVTTLPGPPISFVTLVEGVTGSVKTKTIQLGGSGRLVVTLTNIGDAAIDGSASPVTIVDELPENVEPTGVEGFAGTEPTAMDPVACEIPSPEEVACRFEGTLPPYEGIELEIPVNLLGSPPVAGAPGKVTVSGGGASEAGASQTITVSPEPTPFGVERFSGAAEEEGGTPTVQAGAHPFQYTNTIEFNSGQMRSAERKNGVHQPAMPRNLHFALPAGLVGNASNRPTCDMGTFLTSFAFVNHCPDSSAIGATSVTFVEKGNLGLASIASPVFNLPPARGEPARFGFMVTGDAVLIDTSVDPDDQYRIVATISNTTQAAEFLSARTTFWGTPGDPRHDNSRGWSCVYFQQADFGPCERPVGLTEAAFLRLPVSCNAPLDYGLEVEPWNEPLGAIVERASYADAPLQGCNRAPFDPAINSAPTSKLAEATSGLDFKVTMPNSGLLNGEGIAEAQPKKVEVTLPEGMTLNPSAGEGLSVCTPAQYGLETAGSRAGEGCPEAAKIGSVKISTPLLDEEATGALYQAAPFENPSHSLLGLYLVARIRDRGILVKQAGQVYADPLTGQLTTTFDHLPQLPFSSFELHFREGGRAPLATPPRCGSFQTLARFTPWSASDPNSPASNEIVTRSASFAIERGVDGGACPAGGLPPFKPDLRAGTRNNAAGSFSPFDLRLTRTDGEQEFTHFSIKLPPGVVGKLAGIPSCSDAAIAAAKARTGPHGGAEELASPSCPVASEVGHTLVGSGVGSVLTYVPGKVYLAGPYRGSPLSIAAITAAKVGPFDLGTVVVREALRINPETAEVFVDATGSDPIPHIIQGVVVHARDIRVYVDRPEFVLNPTSCEPTSTAATVLGSGLDFASEADDNPFAVTSRFQAADCASLGFKPRLSLRLKGKTSRGGNPALRAVLRPRVGDANAARISVALPHSEFLDQAHIRTVCTRVQFNAGAGNGAGCPSGAIYGHAKAWTPLFSEPLEGPIFLRSSEHPLPDLVLALHGLVNIDAVGRIDSVNGGIRNTFHLVPDAPIRKVVLNLQGGKKGLLVNSTNICRGSHKAVVKMEGHNGRLHNLRTPLKGSCGKGRHTGRGKP